MSTDKHTHRILIVEDDASIRGLMTKHFRRKGFEVEYAAAAEDVIERFATGSARFDVVVIDIHLPGESGVDLARRIHSVSPEQQVVFMTGDSDGAIARQALKDGAAGYLLKPFQFHEIDTVVNRAIQGNARRVIRKLKTLRLDEVAQGTRQAGVVLAPTRRPRSKLAARVRVGVATAAILGLAWLMGTTIMPAPATDATTQTASVNK